MKKLTDVCNIIYGYAFDSKRFNTSKGIPVIRIRDVVRGYTETFTDEEVSEEYYIENNDLLVGMDGEFNIGSWKGGHALLNQRVCKLVPGKSVSNRYLYHFMPHVLKEIEENTSFVTVKHLSAKHLNSIEFPDISLLEQQKIAAHLDSIQSAIDNKKQQLQQLDELVKSKFVEMFGENPVESGKWKVEKLGDLCSKISDGVHAKPEYTETGMPFISVVNMNTGKLSFDDCKYVSVEAYEKMIKSTNPEKDDILYTKVGATYGISALVDTDKKFCLYVSVALLKPLHDKIDSQFLTSTMMMPYVKQQADNSIKGIGVPDLHLNQIRAFKIAVPPIELQNDFATFVQKIDSAKAIIKTQLVDLQELLDSKVDEYFGE